MSERYNPWKMFDGAFVPNWLMERPEVSPGAKLAFARLTRYAGRKGEAYPTQQQLATALAVSEDQAYRYVRELVKHRLVETERRGRGQPNVYHFVRHPWMDQFREGAEPEPANMPDQETADPQGGNPRIRGDSPIDVSESLKRVIPATPAKGSAPRRYTEVADAIAKAEWERRDRKPVVKFIAFRERIQDALDAGYTAAEISGVLPTMSTFTRNAFDLALGRRGERPGRATGMDAVADYAQQRGLVPSP